MPYSTRNLKYEVRLTKWGINTLKDRRGRGVSIEIYKSVNGLEMFNSESNPVINTPTDRILTRSNGVKIRRDTFKSKIRNDLRNRHDYFFNRISPTWNALPENIVQVPTLNMFKKGLDG